MKQQFNTQKECLLYFEKLRWGKKVCCPYCCSEKTHPSKNEPGRHFCYSCVKSFSVLVGTIFEDTRLNIPIWINIAKEMLKSKNIIPSKLLSERFGITVKTAWLTAMKIRCAMIDNESSLHGLLAMDSNYISMKQKSKKLDKYFAGTETKYLKVRKLNNNPHFRNMGELTPVNLIGLLKHYIKYDESNPCVTSRSYETTDKAIEQISQKYTQHNKIGKNQTLKDNYWAFIKNGIYSENKSPSEKYLPFYLLEHEYKFKRKGTKNIFPQFMKDVFSEHSIAMNLNHNIIKKQVTYA
jgi:transposase-like protein